MKLVMPIATPAGYDDATEVRLIPSQKPGGQTAHGVLAYAVTIVGDVYGYVVDRHPNGRYVIGTGPYRYYSGDVEGGHIDDHTGVAEAIGAVLRDYSEHEVGP